MRLLPLLLAICAFTNAAAAGPAEAAPVTLLEDDASFTLANGIVTARISKRNGEVVSLKYRALDLVNRGYWSFAGRNNRLGREVAASIRISPENNGGERAEISCKFSYQGEPGTLPCSIDIRYALGRGEHGLHAASIWQHQPGDPAFSLGEARYAMKLNPKVFDFMTIDAQRRKIMPTGADWNRGEPLQLKEVRRMTTGRYAGQAEHKYDYSAIIPETPAYGWSSTEHQVGLWLINPSFEYMSGGPTKVELTGHLDVNPGGLPTLLNMWLGSHYGGSIFAVAQDEAWTKVIGPFFIYCNAEADHEVLWKDALARAAKEAQAWPYDWFRDPAYPLANERGSASGRILVRDAFDPQVRVTNLWVGLTAADYPARTRGGATLVDWQRDAKFYQFWIKADEQGRFTIPHVRPGSYTLRAFGDGVPGEFAKADVTIEPGQALDLGELTWEAERYGRTLWQIGNVDRTAAEFRHGDHYWQWGLFSKYPEEFPNDVHFIVGKSDPRRDWNYVQPPRLIGRRVESTTWTIEFELPEALKGTATLRLGIAGSRAPGGIEVAVNGAPAGTTGPLPEAGTMHRDGIRGYWCEGRVTFDAQLLKPGRNLVQLHVPARSWVEGVLYDYVRLEFASSADSGAEQ